MSTGSQSNKTPDPLNVNQILIAEFQYIAQTAFQANEDRARVSNYYLVTTGASVAAVLSAKFESPQPINVYLGFAVLFALLTAVGIMTVLQLARLRAAWTNSAKAMNKIKDYYKLNLPGEQLDTALVWTLDSIPSPRRRKSVAFLLALSVALIDSAMAATSFIYFSLWRGSAVDESSWIVGGVLIGIILLILQLLGYDRWVE